MILQQSFRAPGLCFWLEPLNLSGILSGIGADAYQNTIFIGYKLSVFKHVVPRAGTDLLLINSVFIDIFTIYL